MRVGIKGALRVRNADNVVARRLYSGAGFATLTVRRKYYQPGDVDALILRMPLRDLSDDSTQDVTT